MTHRQKQSENKKNPLSSFLFKKQFFPRYDIVEMTQCNLKKVTEEFLKLRDVEIQKKQFHFSMKMITIDEVDIEKYQYPITLYMTKTKTQMQNTSLDLKLVKQKLDLYTSSFHNQQELSINLEKPNTNFLIKDEILVGKYKLIWNKISNIGKEFDKKPINDE